MVWYIARCTVIAIVFYIHSKIRIVKVHFFSSETLYNVDFRYAGLIIVGIIFLLLLQFRHI